MLSWSQQGACSNNEPARRQNQTIAGLGLSALALLCSTAAVVRAQDLPPGVIATFDITQQLEYSDNPDLDEDGGESDFYGRTILGFGLESVTSIQRFALNLGTDIEEYLDTNDDDFNFDNTFGTLNYTRATRDALFGADLRYRESDADSDFDDDDFIQDGNILTQDDGTRVSYGFALRGAVGQEAPIGASFDWSYNEINFEDTDDPDLNDNTLNQVSGQVDFRIDPTVTLSVVGRYSEFETDDPTGTDRTEQGLGLAAAVDVTPIVTVGAALSYDEIERTGGTDRDDDGISGTIDVTREMPNGLIEARYASEVFANDDGRRSFLSFRRALDLPNGALDLTLGVTGSDEVGTDPLVEANYRQNLPTGQLTLAVRQQVVVDDDDNEDINTSLRAAYDHEINPVSGFGFNIGFFDRSSLAGDTDDSQRIDIGLNYRYDLTRDWGLVSGITYTAIDEDNEDDRDRTTVFIGLARSFSFSP